MKSKPFFSAIIPTYNRAQFLGITVDSVLSQTCEDFELLLIDDGSTDNTAGLMRQYRDKRLRYIFQENMGPAAARNTGIKEACGRYIAFLDSDDRWRANKLLATRESILREQKYRIFHTEEIWYRNGAYLAQKKHHKKPSGSIFANAVALCSIGTSTCAIERSVFDEIGVFDESLPACEDYDFWLRVTNRFEVFLIPQYLTIKEGGHRDQQSKKYQLMDAFRIQALANIIETGALNAENLRLAMGALRKKCAIVINGSLKRANAAQAKKYQDLLSNLEKKYGT